MIPCGEWVIFSLALLAWSEKMDSWRLFRLLLLAWLVGKTFELIMPSPLPWQWHYARLAVIAVFWIWAYKNAEKRILPLVVTGCIAVIETLFQVNDPGAIPYEAWFFNAGFIVAAWLTAKSFWGTAAAYAGSLLFNQVFVRFSYEGIVRYANFPDSFAWNFGVCCFAAWAGIRLGSRYYLQKRQCKTINPLFPVQEVGNFDAADDSDLL